MSPLTIFNQIHPTLLDTIVGLNWNEMACDNRGMLVFMKVRLSKTEGDAHKRKNTNSLSSGSQSGEADQSDQSAEF